MITPQMIVLDVVYEHPETEAVFREYDSVIGVCILCHHLFDSIETIVQIYALNSDELVEKLNGVITHNTYH